MKWKFQSEGHWLWRSENNLVLGQLFFLEGERYRFWTLGISDFLIFSKTHDRALKAGKILRKHLIAANNEMKENKLIIPGENMDGFFRSIALMKWERLEEEFGT